MFLNSFDFFLLYNLLNGLQVGRIEVFPTSHNLLLILQTKYLFTPPLRLSSLSHLALHLSLLFDGLDEYFLDLEFDSAKLDDVVLLQSIRLLHISILNVPHNEIDFLASITRVLQLLPRLCILQIDIFAHEVFFLSIAHGLQFFNLDWLNHIVVSNLSNIEEDLSFAAMFNREILLRVRNDAILANSDQFGGLIRCQLLFLAMTSLIVEQAL